MELIRIQAGKNGFKIKEADDGRFNVISNKTKEIKHKNITFKVETVAEDEEITE